MQPQIWVIITEMEKLNEIDKESISWKYVKHEGLNLSYSVPIPKNVSNQLFMELEKEIKYFTGDLAKVKYVYLFFKR